MKFEVTIWFKLSNNLAKLLFVTTNPPKCNEQEYQEAEFSLNLVN